LHCVKGAARAAIGVLDSVSLRLAMRYDLGSIRIGILKRRLFLKARNELAQNVPSMIHTVRQDTPIRGVLSDRSSG
jgi:hypothetical protein